MEASNKPRRRFLLAYVVFLASLVTEKTHTRASWVLFAVAVVVFAVGFVLQRRQDQAALDEIWARRNDKGGNDV